VYGPKGGVGTSLVAVNLALALHRPDQKVVLVDANFQYGNVGVLLNLQASRTIADLAKTPVDELEPQLVEGILTAHPSGVKVLMAPPRPEMAELVTPELVKKALQLLARSFSFVIVDAWKSLHEPLLTILDEAERIVLVATADIPTLKNVRDFFGVLDALSIPAAKTLFVLNKSDRRTGITAKDVADNLRHAVAVEIPLDDAIALSSINRGIPFVADQRAKPIARAVMQLSDLLVRELVATAEPAASPAAPAVESAEDAARKRLGRLMSR
jgi:pilus assembly protein CpaE